jgi:phospholipid/cholesterol/gamma-HCH transport system substrate-binding protein
MALQDLTPQLRTRLRRVERIVSLFVVLAALLLLAGFAYYLHHTAKRKGWFIPKAKYFTLAMSGEGLNVGDEVALMGFPAGEITGITAEPPGSWYKIFVQFEIRKPYYGYIWSDSKVKIAATGLLGSRRLEVTAGYTGQPTAYDRADGQVGEMLVDGKRLPVTQAHKGVYLLPEEDPALSERAQKLVTTVEQALPNILGLTNQIAVTLNNVAGASAHANQLAGNAVTLTGNANILLTNLTALLADARPIVTNVAVITGHLTNPHGSLGDWVLPADIHTNLNRVILSSDAQLNRLAASLNDTLLNVAAITSNLNQQVQTNDQILAEISRLVVDTDSMVQGLKKHWLLRSAFKGEKSKTNAPPVKTR